MLKPRQEIVVFFRSITEANTTLHVKKFITVTRYGAQQHTTTTLTRSGAIVKVRFSSNIEKLQ